MLRRGLGDVRQKIFTADGVTQRVAVKPDFFQVRFELTNKSFKVVRSFKTILGFFSNLGGVYEIILVGFTFLMTLHSKIYLRKVMLNMLVKRISHNQQRIKPNRITDPNIEIHQEDFDLYSYFEVV